MWNYKNGISQSDSYHFGISLDERRTTSTTLTMSEKELGGKKNHNNIYQFPRRKANNLKTLILELPGMPNDRIEMNASYSKFTVNH